MARTKMSRRSLMKWGLAAGGAGLLTLPQLTAWAKRRRDRRDDDDDRSGSSGGDDGRSGIRFTPFTVELPVPPILEETAFAHDCLEHPDFQNPDVAGQIIPSATRTYEIRVQKGTSQILPGVDTPVYTYNGLSPGATIRAFRNEPSVVKFINELGSCPLATHLHGGHQPADFDGFPSDFIFPPGFELSDCPTLEQALDELGLTLEEELDPDKGCPFQGQFGEKIYCYPNITPIIKFGPGEGLPDDHEIQSTMWYHDHGMDITGANVYFGLAGFYLLFDDLERNLIDDGVLPADEFDIPMVIQDKRFNPDGTLFFDPLNHDGFLGDVRIVNGVAQPFLRVQRRKYRFRFCNGSGARFLMLEMSDRQRFLRIGADSWLLPEARFQSRIFLSNAERADVILDFSNYNNGDEVFLTDILEQDDGRGPDGKRDDVDVRRPGTPLIKFVVEGGTVGNDATVSQGTLLRPFRPFDPREIVKTRHFKFERSQGAWVVNGRLFNPCDVDANPDLDTAERWIIENGGGGWWHPIHMHLEGHVINRINGRVPAFHERFNKDTTNLGPNDVAEIFMRFRTFPGPFAFHCHNIAHEDMRMMGVMDVGGEATERSQDALVRNFDPDDFD